VNPDLDRLAPYPFERLNALLDGVEPATAGTVLRLSVGEPAHAPPTFVMEALQGALAQVARYPTTKGELGLREAQTQWLEARHGLSGLDPEAHVLPVTGTREALFAIAQTCVARVPGALVGYPNPFYQIYEGAALLAGARPALFDLPAERGFLPDPDALDNATWDALQLVYICTPGNPNGAVMDEALLKRFIERALAHDVILVSDECYSEIYPDEDRPPPGLLSACAALGNTEFRNCLSMHSLSKRSNLPGLRSGFAAGDPRLLRDFLRYRSYHGSAMPPHHQIASTAAWSDETHVRENRRLYREKFAEARAVLAPVLDLNDPEGGFYLWPRTPIDDETFTRRLYAETGVIVLPGRYIARATTGGNPGEHRIRLALVADRENCAEACRRIAAFCRTLG